MTANQKHKSAVACPKVVQDTHGRRGFEIAITLMDGECEAICSELAALGITLNTVSREEHMPEAERRHRTIKE